MEPDTESWRRKEQRRVALRQRQDCRFVDPVEFRELVVSRLALERQDDVVAGTRGLLDRESRMLFVIEEESLMSA